MLELAKIMDAWRLVPRVIVAMYGIMIYKLFTWYTAIPTHDEKSCDSALIEVLLEQNIPVESVMEMSCTIIDTVGGPTTQQSSFVSIIIGLSSVMFAFYVNSGGKWEFSKKDRSRWYSSSSDKEEDKRRVISE